MPKGQAIKSTDVKHILKLYKSGVTITDISRITNISRETIYKTLKDFELKD